MPRPKSDLARHQVMLGPADLANLDAIARHHGWLSERGEPSRSRAVRELAAREAKRIAGAEKRTGKRTAPG
jgi:hypothetical protein